MSILEKMGHVANAVANGQEAVKSLETIPYDLVLMDIQMPEMDGLMATSIIRDPKSQVRDHNIPILALTAYAMEGDREKCLAAGMNGYITKPVSIKAIADAIANLSSSTSAAAPHDEIPTKNRRKGLRLLRQENGPALRSPNPAGAESPFGDLSAGSAAAFDSKAFSDRLSGKSASMIKIINITLAETPKLLREFEQAVKTHRQDTAGRLAHNIRGNAANVSANQFLAVAVKIETACNAGEWREAEMLLPELDKQFSILELAMRKFQKILK